MDDEVPHEPTLTNNTAVIGGVSTTTSQGYNAIDELTSLDGSTAGLSYDADGNQKTNPGNSRSGRGGDREHRHRAGPDHRRHPRQRRPHHRRIPRGNPNHVADRQQRRLHDEFHQHHARPHTTDRERGHRVLRPHPDGQLIAATTGTTGTYYLTDNFGSTVGIVSSAGVKTAAYAYDPYGRTRTATGPNAAANAIRYAGGLFDATAGATKFGARYYDPDTGRFTQPDPSGQEQDL